jgi:hypothetical protein
VIFYILIVVAISVSLESFPFSSCLIHGWLLKNSLLVVSIFGGGVLEQFNDGGEYAGHGDHHPHHNLQLTIQHGLDLRFKFGNIGFDSKS